MFPRIIDARLRSRAAAAGLLTAAMGVASAAPALAHESDSHSEGGDTYTVETESIDGRSLPEGVRTVRGETDDLPRIETASAPGAWLSAAMRDDIEIIHTVGEGETLGSIAAAYGLGESDGWRVLFDANDGIERPAHIWPGLELDVPDDGDELAHREVPEPPAPEPPAPEPAPEAPAPEAPAPDAPAPEAPAPETPERQERARASRSGSSGGTDTAAVSGGRWDTLAACESGGDWSINTGNGYYGGLQFSLQSWRAVGGGGYPHQASKAEQIKRAERLLDLQGWGAWPACTRKLGWR